MASTHIDVRRPRSSSFPGLDDLADAVLTLRTRDEARRFLRDLCTLPELEALAHRWQIVRLLDEQRPVPRDRRARADQHGDGHARRAVAAQRHGRLPRRARPRTKRKRRMSAAFTRAGSNGRLTLAVPSKGRMAQPALDSAPPRASRFEATERALARALRERAGRPPARARRTTSPSTSRTASSTPGSRARTSSSRRRGRRHARRARLRPLHARGGGSRTTRRRRELDDLDGLRVATAYPVSTRACLNVLGVEAELVPVSGSVEAAPRLGLSDAIVDLVSTGSTASANGLRLLGTLLESQAVLIAERGRARERAELVDRLELMLYGVVAARRRRYLMMNAPDDGARRDPCAAPRHGRAVGDRPRRARSDRRARGRRRRRDLGPAARR